MGTIDAIRQAEDYATTATCVLGEAAYGIYLITTTGDQIAVDDPSTLGTRNVSIQRLTIADGYRSYVEPDGYLNVPVQQMSGEELIISAGVLTNNLLKLGPIVFPYHSGNLRGGIDSQIFQPQITNKNVQVYIQLRGPTLSINGNFFVVKQIILNHMASVCYYLLLEATSTNPLL